MCCRVPPAAERSDLSTQCTPCGHLPWTRRPPAPPPPSSGPRVGEPPAPPTPGGPPPLPRSGGDGSPVEDVPLRPAQVRLGGQRRPCHRVYCMYMLVAMAATHPPSRPRPPLRTARGSQVAGGDDDELAGVVIPPLVATTVPLSRRSRALVRRGHLPVAPCAPPTTASASLPLPGPPSRVSPRACRTGPSEGGGEGTRVGVVLRGSV